MRRKLLPLLTVFALLLVAVGGAAAAGDASTTKTPDATPTEGGDVGICVVGADSPCNDASAEGSTNDTAADDGERIGDGTAAEDGQMRIPEDQNRDGEIDDRFRGDNVSAGDEPTGDDDDEKTGSDDAGICLVGADSPCNDAANGTDATHPTPMNDSTQIGSESGESDDGQIWIPEDQNRDGDIDDRFLTTLGPLTDIAFPLLNAL